MTIHNLFPRQIPAGANQSHIISLPKELWLELWSSVAISRPTDDLILHFGFLRLPFSMDEHASSKCCWERIRQCP